MFSIDRLSRQKRYDLKKSIKIYVGIEGIDYVECKICKKRSLNIDKRHLKNWHNLSKSEYKKLFPKSILVSEKKKVIQSKAAIGNKANLGRKFSKEHRKKLAKSKIGNKNPFYGKSHSKDTIDKAKSNREKTFISRYGVTNPVYIDGVIDKITKATSHSIDYIKKCIESEDYKLISTKYENIYGLLDIECPEGHKFKMRYNNFQSGQRCPMCYRENNFGINHPNWKNYTEEEIQEFKNYRTNVNQLSNQNFRKYNKQINPNRLKRGFEDYHLDHIYTVSDGFKNNVLPEIISNPNNLQMLWYAENISKNYKSEISLQLMYHIAI